MSTAKVTINLSKKASVNYKQRPSDRSKPDSTRPSPEVEALNDKVRRRNPFKLDFASVRNVLCVGRSRVGKTTSIGVLKDPAHEPKRMSIFSETRSPKFQTFALHALDMDVKYNLSIIDTPGLKDVVARDSEFEAKSDDYILESITTCLKNEITKINALVIFLSVEAGISTDDEDCFRKYIDCFFSPDIPLIIAITRAEDKDDDWRYDLVEQLNDHPYFTILLQLENVKVCFMGCVDSDSKRTLGIEGLKDLYEEVYGLRENFLTQIFESERTVDLLDLPIAQGPKLKAKQKLSEEVELLKRLDKLEDFTFDTAQIMLYEVRQLHLSIKELGIVPFIAEEDLLQQIKDTQFLATAVCVKLPEREQEKFREDMGLVF